ncbi:glycosyltransferase [Parvularcula maris]|uniref:sucrose-phosphate synthase n=1 Tax=Parvularcula maris TaxID=2965077 RepID=A0A9X2RI14_9PROT|nr:glycosyltransferase [Parvularcula maris]MCQ8184456.1 glycosyltransferase [Parvularcula maris]
MHVALQGCLKARNVPYGLTADTGGHIRYLLELVEAAEAAGVQRQEIVTRAFDDEELGPDYRAGREVISERAAIVRIASRSAAYLAKEDLRPELPSLADGLEAYLRKLPALPDVIHAHYADAGWLAARMKERLGIPYVFTAHSLGRVKQQALRMAQADLALRTRIDIEEEAIGRADRIIVSSKDEAVRQYGMYRSTDRTKIDINPPGCDLEAFKGVSGADVPPRLTQAIERFLDDPAKKPILALSRPVRKKNLAGLLRAFGESERLRAEANLLLFAGTRRDIKKETAENREVLEELLYLTDYYDLWGSVALPKDHQPSDVPYIYQYAASRGGAFCNPAFNEPFGLTLLEAAACGLPVVSTHHGGPRDILSICRHGELVDPFSPEAIAEGLSRLLFDEEHWRGCSEAGKRRSSFYGWKRHVQDYLVSVQTLARPVRKAPVQLRPSDGIVLKGQGVGLAASSAQKWGAPSRTGGAPRLGLSNSPNRTR